MYLPDWLTMSRAFRVGIAFVISGCWSFYELYFTGNVSLDESIGPIGTWLVYAITFMGINFVIGFAILGTVNILLVIIAGVMPAGVGKNYLLLPSQKWSKMRGESKFLAGFLVGQVILFYYLSNPFLY